MVELQKIKKISTIVKIASSIALFVLFLNIYGNFWLYQMNQYSDLFAMWFILSLPLAIFYFIVYILLFIKGFSLIKLNLSKILIKCCSIPY